MPTYVVIFTAPYSEADALEGESEALGDSRVTMIAKKEELAVGSAEIMTANATVHMEIDAPTAGSGAKQAREIYVALRQGAGLEPPTGFEPVAVVRKNPLLFLHPRSSTFFGAAERLFNEGFGFAAVVAIQTAFELFMEGAFDYALQLRSTPEVGSAVARLIRHYNMNDKRVRALWKSLTGHSITEPAKTWEAYAAHLDRRDALVHQGEGLSLNDAADSLNAVNELADRVAAVLRGLQPQNPEDEG